MVQRRATARPSVAWATGGRGSPPLNQMYDNYPTQIMARGAEYLSDSNEKQEKFKKQETFLKSCR